MAEQDWLVPTPPPEPSPYQNVQAIPGSRAAVYELRPLSLGELLDRTFSLYRSRFWLFAGIGAVAGAISLVVNVLQAVARHYFIATQNLSPLAMIGSGGVTLAVVAVYFLAYSVTQAATVFALSEVYLGKTAEILSSVKAVASRWYVYCAIAIWQWWSLVWVPVVLAVPAGVAMAMLKTTPVMIVGGILLFLAFTAGIVFGIIFYLRNSLAIQSTVVERLTIRASMRRSKELSSGAKGRIFVVGLISFALYMVFGVMQAPLLFMVALAGKRGSEAIGMQAGIFFITFLANTLISPVPLIGLSLVYFDQRVRKEAFDIAVLLGEGDDDDDGFPHRHNRTVPPGGNDGGLQPVDDWHENGG